MMEIYFKYNLVAMSRLRTPSGDFFRVVKF